MSNAFDSGECALLADALDQAWTAVLASGFKGDGMAAKAVLSQGLLHAAERGERRLPELVRQSLAYFARPDEEERAG